VADLDVSKALAEQQCAEEAQGKAAAALQARMSGEVGKKQTEASAAWKALSPQAEQCLQLKDVASRKPCIEKVGQFVVWAEGLKVEAKAGFESVPTACGARSVPIAAQVMAVPVAEVAEASAMLLRLKEQQPAASGQNHAASGGDYEASDETMRWLVPGSFTMGCTPGQSDCGRNERPTRTVSLSGFWMARVETTQLQWKEVMGRHHRSYSRDCGWGCPVVKINWCEAVSFANARSTKEGLKPAYELPWSNTPTGFACDVASSKVTWDRSADGYRLPTEAEWEYAARAGRDTLYAGGTEIDDLGWHSGNSNGKVHPVGQKRANDWGLYDMSGNVWEWVWDWYGVYNSVVATETSGPTSGARRVLRGGCFVNTSANSRVAERIRKNPHGSFLNFGFRLARGVPGP
jgi:formylglycine-generating enzyme required for sulfatase activity